MSFCDLLVPDFLLKYPFILQDQESTPLLHKTLSHLSFLSHLLPLCWITALCSGSSDLAFAISLPYSNFLFTSISSTRFQLPKTMTLVTSLLVACGIQPLHYSSNLSWRLPTAPSWINTVGFLSLKHWTYWWKFALGFQLSHWIISHPIHLLIVWETIMSGHCQAL